MKQISALILLFGLFLLSLYFLFAPKPPLPSEPSPYIAHSFESLKGWQSDNHLEALLSFQISCARLLKYPGDREYNGFGLAKDWKPACQAATQLEQPTSSQAKELFENEEKNENNFINFSSIFFNFIKH